MMEQIKTSTWKYGRKGETEASSAWFPTIDSPNEKTTEEIYITVKDKYTTLSNGLLLESSST